MNKTIITLMAAGAIAAAAALTMTSCSDNNDGPETPVTDSKEIDITSGNISSWTNYMRQVSTLLSNDANSLYRAWTESYNGGAPFASQFKNHDNPEYPSALSCVEEIIDKCAEIANEVGQAKIGDPYALYMAGQHEQALYAVESWYSWHSRDDYTNNIHSVRNAYCGSLDGSISPASLSALIAATDPELDKAVRQAISDAANAIQAIQQPLRNNINSAATVGAMSACATLEEVLNMKLKPVATRMSEQELQPVIDNYVDNVVVPTYALLKENNAKLHSAVLALAVAPSNSNFEAACQAWMTAREPWEKSEAFLFGPVDALGLDPNMDSWPLDQDNIVQILNSGNYEHLDWSDGDDDDAIEARQGVRGFHTLEFLLFKDGKPRTINF